MGNHTAVIEGTNSGLVLSDRSYNVLRGVVEKVLPGLGAFYALVAGFWGLGHIVEVVGTLAGLATFCGILLTLARAGYVPPTEIKNPQYDGEVVSDVIDGQTALRLELNDNATQNLLNKQSLLIKGVSSE